MTARGVRNNNPLNIRYSAANKWQGKDALPLDPEFETFEDPIMGLRAGAVLIIAHYDRRGANTIAKLIKLWAPPKGKGPKGAYTQNTKAYISGVAQDAGFSPDDVLDFHRYDHIRPVMVAMIQHENNNEQPYTDAQIDKALTLAGVQVPAKPLTQTRTVKGGQVAGAGVIASAAAGAADFMADHSQDLWDTLSPWLPYLKGASIGFLVLAAVGISWMLWARIDDRRRGLR